MDASENGVPDLSDYSPTRVGSLGMSYVRSICRAGGIIK